MLKTILSKAPSTIYRVPTLDIDNPRGWLNEEAALETFANGAVNPA